MKRFQFSLERVHDWRRLQLETEEAKLERITAEREDMARQGRELEERGREAEQSVWSGRAIDAAELRALDDFRQYIDAERRKLEQRIQTCEQRITAQRARVLEERRKTRLLDRLRERRHAEWRKEFDRELATLAEESFLARFINPRGKPAL